MKEKTRVIIENLKPQINCGEFPVKRVVGEKVVVTADIFCDGHDTLSAELIYRKSGEKEWNYIPMDQRVNDSWHAEFRVDELGDYEYSVHAWVDHFKTWSRDLMKRIEAETDYETDLIIGAELIENTIREYNLIQARDKEYLEKTAQLFKNTEIPAAERAKPAVNDELYLVMIKYPLRKNLERYAKDLNVIVDPKKARFSAWYELFPRSVGVNGKKHGSFRDMISHLDYVDDLGFDTLYLPPIHPIGETKRKGPNNNPEASDDDPGSPWAIGSKDGGHKSIHPDLGSFEELEELVKKAKEREIDIALDIAFQCSPDHPYVEKHPEWFKHRPDGSIQYAENPPKKYEDIYPFNFESEAWESLWDELKSIFDFWIDKGVKVFRVDNPHTKSLRFWGWAISEIKKAHPEVIFLSEAFTRPKVMKRLAKEGFTQSYTYFTWRNTKYELESYMKDLVKTEAKEYFRPNFWPNTPDILPEFLQYTGKPGYLIRLILAATLSSNYGIYGPAFELLESEPLEQGREEYKDSEKYEIKKWEFGERESIGRIFARINRIRKENTALHNTNSLRFHDVDNDMLICYSKESDDGKNIILAVVNLDPHHTHSGWIRLPLDKFGMDDTSSFQAQDLLAGSYFLWHGEYNYVEIDPGIIPAHIFRIRKKVRTERDFDYFM